jgi:hypothetical protein
LNNGPRGSEGKTKIKKEDHVKHIKAHTLLGGALLVVVALALTAGPLAAMALGWESDGFQVAPRKDLDDWKALAEEKGVSWRDAVTLVEIVESRHSEVREPSEKQMALFEAIRGKSLPLPRVIIPVDWVCEDERQAREERVAAMKQLWGQDISIGEVLERVFPEAMEGKCESTLARLRETPMGWIKPPKPSTEHLSHGRSTKSTARLAVEGEIDPHLEPAFIIVVTHDSDMHVTDLSLLVARIDFSSSSRVWLPHPWYRIPQMGVISKLWYWDVPAGVHELKDLDVQIKHHVYRVEAAGGFLIFESGLFSVTGEHWGTFPANYIPPIYHGESWTDWKYVSP